VILQTIWAVTEDLRGSCRVTRSETITNEAALMQRLGQLGR
jgi:hypothetical protein